MKRILATVFIFMALAAAIVLLAANPAEVILPTGQDARTAFSPEESLTFAELLPHPVPMPEPEPIELFLNVGGHAGYVPHFISDAHIEVEIFSDNPAAEIFFTTDGSAPTRESSRYSAPLTFVRADTCAVVLRAIAVYGETSASLAHTFFMRRDIYERFGNVLIFSVATTDDYLYCFYTGIFVEGVIRRDYLAENPGAHVNPLTPANFTQRGRESEIPVHVEVFYPCGERILAQYAGGRVFGSWSRGEPVKSVRLIARREYSPHAGRFHYEFFPGDTMRNDSGEPIRAYNTLILRNGGNDRNHGILRNELGSTMLRRAGVLDVTPVRAAAMFINGRYYGYVWLQTRYDAHHLQEQFGTPTRNFDVIGRGEWWFRNATEEQEEALAYKNMFAYEDLTCDETFARLEAVVCVDNLLFYYAFQIFLANNDWPHNNLRRWRYVGQDFPGRAPELDGRWRYAYFDLDQTFGLFGSNYGRNTFQRVLEHDNDAGCLLRAILLRPDMAERFTMIFCDIAANVVNEEIVGEILQNLFADISGEVDRTIEAELLAPWTSWYTIERYQNTTMEFAARRYTVIFDNLARFFDFDRNDMFRAEIHGGEAIIGTQRGTSSRYFSHLTVPVEPILPPGSEFGYWTLNGRQIFDERIYINASDAIDGIVALAMSVQEVQ